VAEKFKDFFVYLFGHLSVPSSCLSGWESTELLLISEARSNLFYPEKRAAAGHARFSAWRISFYANTCFIYVLCSDLIRQSVCQIMKHVSLQ